MRDDDPIFFKKPINVKCPVCKIVRNTLLAKFCPVCYGDSNMIKKNHNPKIVND